MKHFITPFGFFALALFALSCEKDEPLPDCLSTVIKGDTTITRSGRLFLTLNDGTHAETLQAPGICGSIITFEGTDSLYILPDAYTIADYPEFHKESTATKKSGLLVNLTYSLVKALHSDVFLPWCRVVHYGLEYKGIYYGKEPKGNDGLSLREKGQLIEVISYSMERCQK